MSQNNIIFKIELLGIWGVLFVAFVVVSIFFDELHLIQPWLRRRLRRYENEWAGASAGFAGIKAERKIQNQKMNVSYVTL